MRKFEIVLWIIPLIGLSSLIYSLFFAQEYIQLTKYIMFLSLIIMTIINRIDLNKSRAEAHTYSKENELNEK